MTQGRYRRGGVLIALVTVAFGGIMLLDLVSIGSTWMEIQLLQRAAGGATITDQEATANDLRQGLVGLARLPWYIFTVVVFCMWVFRASKNARALGAEGMEFTPGWTVGWFFIPIANLWKPFQAVSELWRASDPLASPAGGTAWQASPKPTLVNAWWAMWIISNLASNVALRLTMPSSTPTIEELQRASWVSLASDVVDVPAAVLALLVCRGLFKRLELKAAAVHDHAPAA